MFVNRNYIIISRYYRMFLLSFGSLSQINNILRKRWLFHHKYIALITINRIILIVIAIVL